MAMKDVKYNLLNASFSSRTALAGRLLLMACLCVCLKTILSAVIGQRGSAGLYCLGSHWSELLFSLNLSVRFYSAGVHRLNYSIRV